MGSKIIAEPVVSRCLVVGTGIAGLQFALLAAAQGTVRLVTKKESRESNTNYAQGGIAAAVSPLDDFESHITDTLTAGAGLCREDVVRRMVEAGPDLIERLLSYGIQFSREQDGVQFALGREGGHSRRRVLHCQDLTGREIESRLLAACAAHPDITLEEDHMGLDLVRAADLGLDDVPGDRIVGCTVLDRTELTLRPYLADAVVLATGGCGKVYSYTSNPDIATGDGLAMAYRAGAELRNLEFVQFHPTCLYHPEAKSFLISEAVRGEGAVLINHRGERFMQRYHPQADLAPRDVVARSIDQEMKTSGDPCAYLDLRHLDRDQGGGALPQPGGAPAPASASTWPATRFRWCRRPTTCAAAWRPTGWDGPDITRLYAIGEVACTGVHGANRLASNSLLEAVFFAERAAAAIADIEPVFGAHNPAPLTIRTEHAEWSAESETMVLEHDWDQVRRVMWDYVGIVRDRERLDIALERLRAIRQTVETSTATSVVNRTWWSCATSPCWPS